jgi:hypothetical protein
LSIRAAQEGMHHKIKGLQRYGRPTEAFTRPFAKFSRRRGPILTKGLRAPQ